MEFNEKEFKKMVRRANYKRTSIGVGISLLVFVLVTTLISLIFLIHFNYIDFGNKENPKVKGLPNSSIRRLDGTEGYLDLLFDQSGGFEMNGITKEMTVFIDYYEQGQLKQHDEIFGTSVESEKNEKLNGVLYWGISEDNDRLTLSFNSMNGGIAKGAYDLKEFQNVNWSGASGGISGKIEKQIPDKYLLFKFVDNEDGMISMLTNKTEEFSQENIEKNDKLLLFYAEFK